MTLTLSLPLPPSRNHSHMIVKVKKWYKLIPKAETSKFMAAVTNLIKTQAREQEITTPFDVCHIHYFWTWPDLRERDYDNFVKIPNDCIRDSGVITRDSWKCVRQVGHNCNPIPDKKNAGVVITITKMGG